MCTDEDRRFYDCGSDSMIALMAIIGNWRTECEPKDTDRVGRTVGHLPIGDLDVGAELVRQGWAVAFRRYSRDYLPLDDESPERQARHVGLARSCGRGNGGPASGRDEEQERKARFDRFTGYSVHKHGVEEDVECGWHPDRRR
jgi:endonuclease YncB( thermonuclease family)